MARAGASTTRVIARSPGRSRFTGPSPSNDRGKRERGALPDCATLRLRSARAAVAAYSEAPTAQQGRQTAPKTRSLTFAGGHRKRPRRSGAAAQLGERCNRTAEVVSSNLISSTNLIKYLRAGRVSAVVVG